MRVGPICTTCYQIHHGCSRQNSRAALKSFRGGSRAAQVLDYLVLRRLRKVFAHFEIDLPTHAPLSHVCEGAAHTTHKRSRTIVTIDRILGVSTGHRPKSVALRHRRPSSSRFWAMMGNSQRKEAKKCKTRHGRITSRGIRERTRLVSG
jgi:hypothetical protein